MKHKAFYYAILFLIFCVNEATSEEKPQAIRNPFLTPEEEMRELGIKPMRKEEVIPFTGLELTGIFYRVEGERFAIINSEFYKEGDTIGDFTIKEIKPLSIIVVTDSKERELKLKHILAITPAEEKKPEPGLEPIIEEEGLIKELEKRQQKSREIFKK